MPKSSNSHERRGAGKDASGGGPGARPGRIRLTAAHKVLLAIFGAFFALLLLGAVELVLRIAGYGPDLRAFIPRDMLGRPEFVFNRDVSLRYFPPEMTRLPGFVRFPATKAPGTWRVFSLGASSTVGDPFGPAAAYSAYLGEMLQDLHPDRRIEIVNCGIVAISSTNVLDLFDDVLDHDPDAVLLYTGHNEAYGADAVLSGLRGTVDTRAGLKFRLWLRNTKLGLLAQDIARGVRKPADGTGRASEREFGMDLMEGKVLPEWSGLHRAMLRIYRGNLEEMLAGCRRRGVTAILCTLPSNLRDQSPLGSGHGPKLPADRLATWQQSFEAGRAAMERGQWEEALTRLREAVQADSFHAETRFRLARCLDRTGQADLALGEYRAARDLDIVHFRACGEQNQIIREVAAKAGSGVILVDLERRLAEVSPDGIPGREFLTEHVHPLIDGHHDIARWIVEALDAAPPAGLGPATGGHDPDLLADRARYRQRLGIEPIDDAAGLVLTLRHKLAKWPFTQACENRQASRRLRADIDSLARGLDPFAASVLADLEQGRFPDGFDYGHRHQEIARRALAAGNPAAAAEAFARASRHFGPNAELTVNQAQATLLEGDLVATDSLLSLAEAVDATFARTLFVRAMLRGTEGRAREARELFQQYLQREPTGIYAQAARLSTQGLDGGLGVGVTLAGAAAGGSR